MALNLSGSNQNIIGENYSFISGATELSGCLWLRLEETSRDYTLMSQGIFSGGQPLLFWRDQTAFNSGRINTVSIMITDSSEHRVEGETNLLNDNNWHHVAFTYKSNGFLRLYFDGVEDPNSPSITNNSPISSNGLSFRVGAPDSLNSSKMFNGDVADIRLYSRELSQKEVLTISSSRGKDNIIQNLELRWQCKDGGTGQIAIDIQDISKNNRLGTAQNFPEFSGDLLKKRSSK